MKKNFFFGFVVAVVVLTLVPVFAWAADVYPSRPIQVIVPFPPGGVADLVARPFASVLEKELKQPVAVVNKTGAGGAVGMQSAAVSRPDGYTLMVALSSISVMPEVDALFGRPSTYKLKDFAPIALLSADPTILVVKKESPWKTVADFVADAKKRPNEIKYSSSGVYGTMHVAMEMFAHAAGIKLRHIPTGRRRPGPDLASGRPRRLPSPGVPTFPSRTSRREPLRVLAGWGDKRLPCPAGRADVQGIRIQRRGILHLVRILCPGGHSAGRHQSPSRGDGQGGSGPRFQGGHGEDGNADLLPRRPGVPEILGPGCRTADQGGPQYRQSAVKKGVGRRVSGVGQKAESDKMI